MNSNGYQAYIRLAELHRRYVADLVNEYHLKQMAGLYGQKQSGRQEDAMARYLSTLRSPSRGFWAGESDEGAFFVGMGTAIERGLTEAWELAAEEAGIQPQDLSQAERDALRLAIFNEQSHIAGLSDFIEANSKANGGNLSTVFNRLDMWAFRWLDVFNQASVMARADQMLRWVWNPRKEHCEDCEKLNGRVYRASTWARWDVRPQSPKLACHGFFCGCRFEPTTDRATPGRPPGLTG